MEYGHFDVLNFKCREDNHSIILQVLFLKNNKVPTEFKEFQKCWYTNILSAT